MILELKAPSYAPLLASLTLLIAIVMPKSYGQEIILPDESLQGSGTVSGPVITGSGAPAVNGPAIVGGGYQDQYAVQEHVLNASVPMEGPAYASSRVGVTGDVWELSTRGAPCCVNTTYMKTPPFQVYRIENRRWQTRTFNDFLASTSANMSLVQQSDGTFVAQTPLTIIYVHGNWMTEENARERVQTVNCAIARHATRPYRIVMLSWPSQRDRGFVSDIRENAECADVQAHYVNYVLQQLGTTTDISLLGFSFGARTVMGALHLAGGGTINGYSSHCGANCVNGAGPRFRVSLVAPAVDRAWIAPGGRFERASYSVDWLVNLYNSRDPVLRRFRFLNNLSNPIAAGFRGFGVISDPRATTPLATNELIEQYDCGPVVGTSHDEKNYYSNCPYFQKAIKNLLWEPVH